MTKPMTDPMDALKSFRQAVADGDIAPIEAESHDDLLAYFDRPEGVHRFTYALRKGGEIAAIAIFAKAEPIDGVQCMGVGYAVIESFRSKGYGAEVVRKSFDEVRLQSRKVGVTHLYVEAVVSIDNEPSNRIARKLFSAEPKAGTDQVSGQPSFQYIRKLF